jgi:hypothetical protein
MVIRTQRLTGHSGWVLPFEPMYTSDIPTLVDFCSYRLTEHEIEAIWRLTGHTSHDTPDILRECTHDKPSIPLPINGT